MKILSLELTIKKTDILKVDRCSSFLERGLTPEFVREAGRILCADGKKPYEVLGVSPQATPDEAKAAYRRLMKIVHPDHVRNEEYTDCAEKLAFKIRSAYRNLSL